MAYVMVLVTDMGNGGAVCSNCSYDLDKGQPMKYPIPDHCPRCKEKFTYQEEPKPYQFGGSDF